jgi:hypothetical protein
MKPQFYALALLMSLLYACSGQTSITYNAPYCDQHAVKIDDTLTLKSNGKEGYLQHRIKTGKHTLTIDGGKPVTFEIENESVLNIAQEEFVIFPVKYTFGEREFEEFFGIPNKIRIDSFIVGSPSRYSKFGEGITQADLKKISNGNEETELLKIDRNQLVINKTWEIGLSDKIPASMSESVTKGTKSSVTYRKTIREAEQFLYYADATGAFSIMHMSEFPN